jgi:hypothetical protein
VLEVFEVWPRSIAMSWECLREVQDDDYERRLFGGDSEAGWEKEACRRRGQGRGVLASCLAWSLERSNTSLWLWRAEGIVFSSQSRDRHRMVST